MRSIFDSAEFNERLFFPRSDASTAPEGATDVDVDVGNASLHARVHDYDDARATVVVFHGNGEVVADYDESAHAYRDVVRARLIVVDYRGYGRSTGTPTLRACIEDAVRVVRAVDATRPLVVLGRSLGGACSAEIAQQDPALADAIVMESAGCDPLRLLARRGMRADAPLTDEETRVFDPRGKLARCRLPTLVLHGDADEIIHPDEARANFAACGANDKRLVMVPGRGHNDVMCDDVYWSALADFVGSLPPRG